MRAGSHVLDEWHARASARQQRGEAARQHTLRAEFRGELDGATAELSDADTFEIGFNAGFLRSIARAYEADTAVVRLIAPNRAVVFEDQEDRYLLMPITLD